MSNKAVAKQVQADTVNSGKQEGVRLFNGQSLGLFSVNEDGHYSITVSSNDGHYVTATVIVNNGNINVINQSYNGVEVVVQGNAVRIQSVANPVDKPAAPLISFTTSFKLSWLKTA